MSATMGGWGSAITLPEPIIIVPNITEPLTVEEAKAQCRIDFDDYSQNLRLGIYIAAARDYIEWRVGMTIHEKTLEWALNYWPYSGLQNAYGGIPLVLPRATPLIDVLSVKYVDSGGTEHTWDPSQYVLDTRTQPGALAPAYGVAYPSFIAYPSMAIRVQYRAGIEIASPITDTPNEIKYPMLLLVAAMNENAEAEFVPSRTITQTLSLTYGVETYIDRLRSRSGGYAF